MSLGVLSIGGRRGIGARPTHGALPMRVLLFYIGTVTAPHKAVAPIMNPLLARVTQSPIFCFSCANSVSTRACGAVVPTLRARGLALGPAPWSGMMVIQMLIVVGLRARNNFPLLVFPKSGFLWCGSAFVAAGHRFCVSKKQLVITPKRVLSTQPILTLITCDPQKVGCRHKWIQWCRPLKFQVKLFGLLHCVSFCWGFLLGQHWKKGRKALRQHELRAVGATRRSHRPQFQGGILPPAEPGS